MLNIGKHFIFKFMQSAQIISGQCETTREDSVTDITQWGLNALLCCSDIHFTFTFTFSPEKL